jgi:outer membrane protein assembly factor BamB
MKILCNFICLCTLLPFALPHTASGDDVWGSFRNGGTGVVADVDLPVNWTPESIAWRSVLPGYGQSSPVIWKGTIYVTSSSGPWQQQCLVSALRLEDGQLLWTREFASSGKLENYFRNSRGGPTSCVDERGVYSFFGTGDVLAIDHDGLIQWSLSLTDRFGEIVNERGAASSLAQDDSHVYIVIDHHGPSYILSINKSDGSIAWKTERGTRVPSWSSPIFASIHGEPRLLISSSDSFDVYDPSDGRQVLQIPGLQGNHIPSATVQQNRVYVGSSMLIHQSTDEDAVARSNCCIEFVSGSEGQTDGQLKYEVLWEGDRVSSHYSTPLAIDKYVYYVNKVGVLYCVDSLTGKQYFAKRIGNPCWASPLGVTHASGKSHVYLPLLNGTVIVLETDDSYQEIGRNRVWAADEHQEMAELAAAMRKANQVPADQAKPKEGPERILGGLSEKQLHQMFEYGDPTIYGIAAVDGHLVVRTGMVLYCIKLER